MVKRTVGEAAVNIFRIPPALRLWGLAMVSGLLATGHCSAQAQNSEMQSRAKSVLGGPLAPSDSLANLPDARQAMEWIEKTPAVAEAREALAAAGHAGAAIAASPYEWAGKIQGQQRRYADTGANSREWIAQIERPIRINGKAELDQKLGGMEQEIANARLGEARHEAARTLATLWMDALASARVQSLYAEQLVFARENHSAVERRRRAGDASALDVNVALADLGEVQRLASGADTQVVKARARLQLRFPGALLPEGPLEDPPRPPSGELAWRSRVLEHSESLRGAQSLQSRARMAADRVRADRIPDPVVGIFSSREDRGNESVIGLSIAIPLSGTYREQRALQFLRESDAARFTLDRRRQEVEVEAAETYAEAVGSRVRWEVAERAAMAASESARLTQRAYALGESDLQALLLSRRQSLEGQRGALEARIDALRWHHRLLIDAHLIWVRD